MNLTRHRRAATRQECGEDAAGPRVDTPETSAQAKGNERISEQSPTIHASVLRKLLRRNTSGDEDRDRTGVESDEVHGTDASEIQRRRALRKASGAEPASAVDLPAKGGGAALDVSQRARMEQSLGGDLSSVRIHTGPESAGAAKSLRARAFTVGRDVHFAAGQFEPGTKEGDHLLAHELAHTLQSPEGEVSNSDDLEVSEPGEPVEREADSAADAAVATLHAGGAAGAKPALGKGSSGVRRKVYCAPDYATQSNSTFSAPAEAPHSAEAQAILDMLNRGSQDWVAENVIEQPIVAAAGGQSPMGRFVVSRHRAGVRPNDANGHVAESGGTLAANGAVTFSPPGATRTEDGAMIRFIDTHPALSRLWGFRLLRNQDGIVTHVVTPLPETFNLIRQSLQGDSQLSSLAPASDVHGADHRVNDAEFAQSWNAASPVVSMVSGDLFYHDLLQHAVGAFNVGSRTVAHLHLVRDLVEGCYRVADQVPAEAQRDAMEGAQAMPNPRAVPGAPRQRRTPSVQEVVRYALRSSVDDVAGSGAHAETAATRLGELFSAPNAGAAANRARMLEFYEAFWTDGAAQRPPASKWAEYESWLPEDQREIGRQTHQAALQQMQTRFSELRAPVVESHARRLEQINADIDEVLQRNRRAEEQEAAPAAPGQAPPIDEVFSLTVAGHRISLLDEYGMQRTIEQIAVEQHQSGLDRALADARAARDAAQASVNRDHNQQAELNRRVGGEGGGVAAPDDNARGRERRADLLTQLTATLEQQIPAIVGGREAFLLRFEQIGVRTVQGIFARAEAERMSHPVPPARAENQQHHRQGAGHGHGHQQAQAAPRQFNAHDDAEAIRRARAGLNSGFIWSQPELVRAISRATNISQHPLHGAWVAEEQQRRAAAAPQESHLVRNVLIGALVVAGVVVTAGLLVEAGAAGAGVIGAAGETAAAESAGASVFEVAASGEITGVRAVVEAASIDTGLAGAVEAEEAQLYQQLLEAGTLR